MAARGCNSTHGAFYCHGLCQKTRASLRTYTKALRRKHRHGVQAAGAIDLPPLSRVQARLVGSAECGAVAQVLDSLVEGRGSMSSTSTLMMAGVVLCLCAAPRGSSRWLHVLLAGTSSAFLASSVRWSRSEVSRIRMAAASQRRADLSRSFWQTPRTWQHYELLDCYCRGSATP